MELENLKKSIVAKAKRVKNVDVFFEKINKLEDELQERKINQCFSVEFINPSEITVDKDYSDVSVGIEIMFFSIAPITNAELLEIGTLLDKEFRPVFHFENRNITIESTNVKIVDNVLHFKFPLRYCHYTGKHDIEKPLMGTLEMIGGNFNGQQQ